MEPTAARADDHGPFLSLTEAAALLKCHHNTVRAWVRQGKLEAIPMGAEHVPMYRKDDLVALRRPLEKAGVIVHDNKHAFPVVGIGASAGGLDAVSKVLATLPTDLGLAYVIVQHLEADREPVFAELVRKKTAMPVYVAENGMRLDPDVVYVIPGGTYAAVVNTTFTLRTPDVAPRPIDAFFTQLADEYQNNAIGIVLSGTGMDGTEGLRAIRAEDGLTIAQDSTALEQGMPQSALEAEVVEVMLRPEAIGPELAGLIKQLYRSGAARIPGKQENELRRILQYLHAQRGIDFTQYKEATIHRRIIRRMVLSKCRKLSDYSALLHGTPSEVDTLCNDMLINVTSFFRDPLFFKALEQEVFPALLAQHPVNSGLRIWVPACAGGEEVVSIAITLLEHIGDGSLKMPVQFFCTDLNERTIEKARLGIYKKHALQNMDPKLVEKYFQHVDGHYQVIKPIREMCVFAKHDLLKDPPFSRVDLISCQNVLIYFDNAAQARVIKSFHYALKPTGFLALGKSESVSAVDGIFDQPDRNFKVYTKKNTRDERLDLDVRYRPSLPQAQPRANALPLQLSPMPADLDRDTEKLLLDRYMPACVLVGNDLNIVRFRGNTAPFLAPATGKASLKLLKMVRQDLVFELSGLLRKAKKEKSTIRKSGVTMRVDEAVRRVSLEVVPVGDARDLHYLVLFKEDAEASAPAPPDGRKRKYVRDERERRIIQLEQELAEAREQMRTAAEEAENYNQELQSASEEVVSSNEELQSINEELETSKEELQSINEEFATINEELQARNEALFESEERFRLLAVNMDQLAWMAEADGSTVWFNDRWEQFSGIPIAEMRERSPELHHPEHYERVTASLHASAAKGESWEETFPLKAADGSWHWFLSRAIPVRDADGSVYRWFGTSTDITAYTESTRRLELATKVGNLGIWDWDVVNNAINWTDAVYPIHGVEKETFEPTLAAYKELIHPDDRDRLEAAIKATLEQGAPYEMELRTLNAEGTVNWVYTTAVVIREHGKAVRMLGGTMNITARRETEDALRMSEQRISALAANLPQLIFIVDSTGKTTWVNDKWAAYFGLSSNDVVDEKWVEAVHPDDMEPMVESWSTAFAEKRDWEHTFRIKNREGEYRWFLSRATPLRSAEGEVLRWFGSHTDVTEQREASSRIRESEERFRLLADNMDQLAWMASPDGSTLWFNQRWEEFSGIPLDQIRDKAPTELHHPDHYERVTTSLQAAGAKGENWEGTFPLKGKDGKWHWFLSRVMPHKDAEGKVIRWFGTSTDITDQREKEERLEVSEERFRLLSDNIGQLAWIAEPDGDIHWYNKRWFDFTGTTLEEMKGWGWQKIHHPDHVAKVTAKFKHHIENGIDWQDTFPIRGANGAYHWFLSRAFPVRDADGTILRWFGTNTDITEQKQAEEALEETAKHKDHFLATLAHELRNPLAPIKNGLQLLELSGDDPEISRKTQAMMARQVEHMVRLVDDLMDVSRISRGKIDLVLERVDLDRVIATAIEASDPLIQQREHHLAVTLPRGPWEVRGDMVRLTQVVANLLNNSAKYTDRGGKIELHLEREGHEVAIHVKDNGIGIEGAALPLVFDMFAQVSSAEKKVEGGLGIGLHIVKRLVEMHAGRIEARSEGLGRGSEFTVWLPLLEKPADHGITHTMDSEPDNTMHTRRVLIVDDNEDAALTMSLILKKRGHTVEVAHDGLEAVTCVPAFKPQIVFMDIGMPRMNGYEACAAMRAIPEGQDMTIVALSGWGQEEDKRKAEEAGFDRHLVKPIDGATMLQVISENSLAG